MKKFFSYVAAAIMLGSLPTICSAETPIPPELMIMPNFANIANLPNSWTVDRYQPATFSDVGKFKGSKDVLGIGISSVGSLANRDVGFQSTFYNTQGQGHAAPGGIGSVLSADLYIPAAWQDPANGSVRTDMWGVMSDGASVTDYTIIGFTNYGDGGARLRVWDENSASGWVDLTSTNIKYNTWNTLQIRLLDGYYQYYVNGTQVYPDTTTNGSVQFQSVLMQAYNFDDPSISGAVIKDYTALWSNTQH